MEPIPLPSPIHTAELLLAVRATNYIGGESKPSTAWVNQLIITLHKTATAQQKHLEETCKFASVPLSPTGQLNNHNPKPMYSYLPLSRTAV